MATELVINVEDGEGKHTVHVLPIDMVMQQRKFRDVPNYDPKNFGIEETLYLAWHGRKRQGCTLSFDKWLETLISFDAENEEVNPTAAEK